MSSFPTSRIFPGMEKQAWESAPHSHCCTDSIGFLLASPRELLSLFSLPISPGLSLSLSIFCSLTFTLFFLFQLPPFFVPTHSAFLHSLFLWPGELFAKRSTKKTHSVEGRKKKDVQKRPRDRERLWVRGREENGKQGVGMEARLNIYLNGRRFHHHPWCAKHWRLDRTRKYIGI